MGLYDVVFQRPRAADQRGYEDRRLRASYRLWLAFPGATICVQDVLGAATVLGRREV